MGQPGGFLSLRRILLIGAAFFTANTSLADASPWARNAGELFVISRAEYFRTPPAHSAPPGNLSAPPFQRIESSTYFEYGFTAPVTLGCKIVYGVTRSASPDDARNDNRTTHITGLSEAQFFTQYQLLRDQSHALSVRAAAILPARLNTGTRPGLRSAGEDIDIAFLYGRNVRRLPGNAFAASELSYRKRFGDAADQIRAQATVGVEPTRSILLLTEIQAEYSLRNNRMGGADYDIVKLQPSIVWRAGRQWRVEVGLREEVAGRNLALGRTFFLGLWARF